MKEILKIENLSVSFGNNAAVKNVSFGINKGETVALVGESGSGKSITALATVNLIDQAANISGSVKYCEKEIINSNSKDLQKIRGNDISFIFQEPMTSLNPLHKPPRQRPHPAAISSHANSRRTKPVPAARPIRAVLPLQHQGCSPRADRPAPLALNLPAVGKTRGPR